MGAVTKYLLCGGGRMDDIWMCHEKFCLPLLFGATKNNQMYFMGS